MRVATTMHLLMNCRPNSAKMILSSWSSTSSAIQTSRPTVENLDAGYTKTIGLRPSLTKAGQHRMYLACAAFRVPSGMTVPADVKFDGILYKARRVSVTSFVLTELISHHLLPKCLPQKTSSSTSAFSSLPPTSRRSGKRSSLPIRRSSQKKNARSSRFLSARTRRRTRSLFISSKAGLLL